MAKGSESCALCKIVRGETQSEIVFENKVSLAFLDHRPLFPGHCLVIPKEHYATLADLPGPLLAPFFASVQLVARAVEEAMNAEGTFVAANNRVSQSVSHLHFHVVPRRSKDGLRGFFWPRQKYADQQAIEIVQSSIRSAIVKIQPDGS